MCLLGGVCFLLTSCQTAGTSAEKKERITKEGRLSRSIENLPGDTLGGGEASITKNKSASSNIALVATTTKPSNPLDEDRAFQFLNQICALGPRITGSRPMQQQQKLLVDHFSGLGGKVSMQRFRFPHPINRAPQEAANILVEWRPEKKERILICAHYDTRPQGDNARVPEKQRGDTFIGANDGASGVALLMELAYLMPQFEGPYGVDFLLVDAEEFVFSDFPRQRYFWGSEFFARQYQKAPPPHRYLKGVLLDMVGDRHLQIYQDRNSVWWKDTRPITEEIWQVAQNLGVDEFIPRTHPKMRTPIRDDHLMLRNVGKIPTCQIIDFDYPRFPTNRYWHTSEDTPERCSGASMAKVGWVVLEWLRLP
ncbi:MAG: M28 family peptidase [Pirellulales bacterium]|nr:M28 family peptidase [Pirellulales bacterium]